MTGAEPSGRSAEPMMGGVIRQRAHLKVDPADRSIVGRTDIYVARSADAGDAARSKPGESDASAVLRLHVSGGVRIVDVTVDGRRADFMAHDADASARPAGAGLAEAEGAMDAHLGKLRGKGLTRVADKTWVQFNKQLMGEGEPRLAVTLPQAPADAGPEGTPAPAPKEPPGERCVSIAYEVRDPGAGSGITIADGYCFSNGAHMATSAWLPCLEGCSTDAGWKSAFYPVTLELDVPGSLGAAASGRLVSDEGGQKGARRVVKFATSGAALISSLKFAVGPFQQAVPSKPTSCGLRVGLFAPPGATTTAAARAMADSIPSIVNALDAFLGAGFGISELRICFIPPSAILEERVVGHGMVLIPSEILPASEEGGRKGGRKGGEEGEKGEKGEEGENDMDRGVECRLGVAFGVASQLFGQHMVGLLARDKWICAGLAGLVTSKYVAKLLGRNEEQCWWHRRMSAVVDAREGSVAPLSMVSLSDQQGHAYYVDEFASQPLLQFKAELVMWMLEARVGQESFRGMLSKILAGAKGANQQQQQQQKEEQKGKEGHTGEGGQEGGEEHRRGMTSEDFFTRSSKAIDTGVDKKWLQGFRERWVVGRGCPHLVVAFCYNKKNHTVSVAIKQQGDRSANVSGTASVKCCGKDGSGMGMVTLLLGETDGVHKNSIFVGDQSLVIEDVKCHGKVAAKKRKRPQAAAAAAAEAMEVDGDGQVEEERALCGPVKWLGVHHNHEWLASFDVNQPERMWVSQLESSYNVVTQLTAIQGLVGLNKHSYTAVNALSSCLSKTEAFHRVRSCAALALAKTADGDTNWAGLDMLLKYYREHVFNPEKFSLEEDGKPPHGKTDHQATLVGQAVATAIAMVRDSRGHSPQEAVDFVLELMRLSPYDNVSSDAEKRVVAMVQTAGLLVPANRAVFQKCLGSIRTALQRDLIVKSTESRVTCACLQSLASLTVEFCRGNVTMKRDALLVTSKIVNEYTGMHNPESVRVIAHVCSVMLHSLLSGPGAGLKYLVDLFEIESSEHVRTKAIDPIKAIFLAYQNVLGSAIGSGDMQDLVDIALDTSRPLSFRFKVFTLVQELGKRPCYLNRVMDEKLHEEVFVALRGELRRQILDVDMVDDMDAANPYGRISIKAKSKQADRPASPGLQSYVAEQFGVKFVVGQNILGKWRSQQNWYKGKITKIHQYGHFDVLYDDGDTEDFVPLDRIQPEGGWQLASNGANEEGDEEVPLPRTEAITATADGTPIKDLMLAQMSKGTGTGTGRVKVVSEEVKKRRLLDELMRLSSKILNGLKQNKAAQFFLAPVTEDLFAVGKDEDPGARGKAFQEYLKIIGNKPMDLGTVTEKLRGGDYTSPLDFRDDIRQIFKNCFEFNKNEESVVYQSGRKVSQSFETKWKESHIEKLWEAGEIKALSHVETRVTDGNKRGAKLKFEDEDTQRMWAACTNLLKELKTDKRAWAFNEAVDEVKHSAPGYYGVVKQPMDFRKITDKLAAREYSKPSDFKADIELVFANCKLYNKNPENGVRIAGDGLEAKFRKIWDESGIEAKYNGKSNGKKPEIPRDEQMMKACENIAQYIKKHPHAAAFIKPIAANLFTDEALWQKYQQMITKPMDITTILKKLKQRGYKDIDEFKEDMLLIFDNCFTFNPNTDPVHKHGKLVRKAFLKKWQNLQKKFGIKSERMKAREDVWTKMDEVVKKIVADGRAQPFLHPVDKMSVPDYYDVVKNPMDLATVQGKLGRNEYENPGQLRADMLLLFHNAGVYNKEGTTILKQARDLESKFEALWKEFDIESLFARIPAEESVLGTTSEGTNALQNTMQLSNDTGYTQDVSKHQEVMSVKKEDQDAIMQPPPDIPVAMDIDPPKDSPTNTHTRTHAHAPTATPAVEEGEQGVGAIEAVGKGKGEGIGEDVAATAPATAAAGGDADPMAIAPLKMKITHRDKEGGDANTAPTPRPGEGEGKGEGEGVGEGTTPAAMPGDEAAGGEMGEMGGTDAPLATPPSRVVSKIDNAQMQELHKMISMLIKQPSAALFKEPVTLQTFGGHEDALLSYRKFCPEPMDLSTVQKKLKKRRYERVEDFHADMLLIFENCYKFNFHTDPAYVQGRDLHMQYLGKWSKFKKRFKLPATSSVDVSFTEMWNATITLFKTVGRSEEYAALKAAVDAWEGEGSERRGAVMSAITFSPEKSAMKKREPKDPMVLRDQAKGRFRRDVHEALRGVPSLELKAKALVDTLDERWKDAGIERLYSRCPLLELQAKAGPVSRHATRSEGEGRGGGGGGERQATKPAPPMGLKIKFKMKTKGT